MILLAKEAALKIGSTTTTERAAAVDWDAVIIGAGPAARWPPNVWPGADAVS